VTVYRNWTNWWAGWVMALGLLAMTAFVLDPLNVASRPDSDMGWGSLGLAVTAGTMLVAMGGYRLFTRPAVTAAAGGLSITNPTRQWRVPAELVEGTDDTLTYVRVHAGRRRIVCAGLEKSNLSMLRGDQTMDERIAKAIGEAISHGEEGGDVTWRWTRVNGSELVMLCLWVAYFAAGAVVSRA